MHNLFIILVYSFPFAFLFHVTEEFFIPGGFPTWFATYRPGVAQPILKAFLKRNFIYFMIMLIVAFTSANTNFSIICGPLISSGIMGFNAFGTHVFGAIKTHQYSPGMVTAILLLLPITIMTFILAYQLHVTDSLGIVIGLLSGILFEAWQVIKTKVVNLSSR